jgi:hypothetical protein
VLSKVSRHERCLERRKEPTSHSIERPQMAFAALEPATDVRRGTAGGRRYRWLVLGNL